MRSKSFKGKSRMSTLKDRVFYKNYQLWKKEKKDFATTRNFKEASRVAAEIKEFQNQVDTLDKKIKEKIDQERDMTSEIHQLQNTTIISLRNKLNKLKEKHDIDKYNLFVIKEKDLIAIYDHYVGQRQFEDSTVIENELRQCQAEIVILKQDLKLDEKKLAETNFDKDLKNISPAEEETKEESPKIQETLISPGKEKAIENEQDVLEEVKVPDVNQEEQRSPLIDEATKKMKVTILINQYGEIDSRISEMEKKIDEYAANDEFEEADNLTNELNLLKTTQYSLIESLKKLGFEKIEDARSYFTPEVEGNAGEINEGSNIGEADNVEKIQETTE